MRLAAKPLIAAVLAAVCAFCSSGCVSASGSSQAVMGQRILDRYLSPGFTGDLDIAETIPLYLTVTLRGANLRHDGTGWRYDWFEYRRNGPAGTSAHIFLGKRP
jgi:hypothetical protein